MTKSKTNMAVHYSSASNEWQTPKWLFDQLNAEFAFDLDAAATETNALCPRYYTMAIDALKQDWSEGGAVKTVWVNPPYGKVGPLFLRYAYEQTVAHPNLTGVLLVPARPDTAIWHDCCAKGEVRLLRGRLSFVNPLASPDGKKDKAPAPFPSALVIFGARARAGTTAYVAYKEPKVAKVVVPVEPAVDVAAPAAAL